MPAQAIEVDPSQVHSIEVDPSQVSTADRSVIRGIGTSLGNQAKGLFDALSGVFDAHLGQKIGDSLIDAQVDQWHKAKDEATRGNYGNALRRGLAAVTPLIGPLIENSAENITSGDREKAAEGITDLVTMPALAGLSKTIPRVAEMTVDTTRGAAQGTAALVKGAAQAVAQPGAGKILGGAGEVGAGIGAMATLHPVAATYGAASIAKGISRVSRGLAERRAAISESIQAAADKAAAERAALTSGPMQGAQRQPIWAGAQPQPEAAPVPIGPTARPVLPSNRAPYNQDAGPTNVVEMPQPSPLAKWVRSQSGAEQIQPPSLPVRPTDKPTIVQSEPQPKPYDSKAAAKRQSDQAFKMVDILKQADITPGDLADLTMDHWKQVGEATGLGPPSPYAIQRAKFELSKIPDAPQLSPELEAQLRRRGALSIARELADEMQK